MNKVKIFLTTLFCLIISPIVVAQQNFDAAFYPFLGTPYVAQTLEKGVEEPLTINLKEVDCTTFVEYVLASQIAEMPADETNILYGMTVEQLRYRGGNRTGYLSRLHYFTEWIDQQIKANTLVEILPTSGAVLNKKEINFMSKHAHLYPMLQSDTTSIDSLRLIEKNVSQIKWKYTPLSHLDKIIPLLEKGDLIAIVTAVDGLDVQHVGFAYPFKENMHLVHASSVAKKVIIDHKTLKEYLLNSKNAIGIRVLRHNLPQEDAEVLTVEP